MESPEWGELVKIVDAQAKAREGNVLRTPLAGPEKVYEQEFQKGEACGMRLVLALPQTIIESAELDLKEMENAAE